MCMLLKGLCRCGPVVSHGISEVVCERFPKDQLSFCNLKYCASACEEEWPCPSDYFIANCHVLHQWPPGDTNSVKTVLE